MFRVTHSVNGSNGRVCETYAWVSDCRVFVSVCVCLSKNLHSDLIWSGLSLALLWSDMIRNPLSSLRGHEQPALFTPGLPRFMLWSEVMNWSDILVLAEFGFISNFRTDDEYRGDSDLTATEKPSSPGWTCDLLNRNSLILQKLNVSFRRLRCLSWVAQTFKAVSQLHELG